MCTIEAELESLLGEFCIKMKGNCHVTSPFFLRNSSSCRTHWWGNQDMLCDMYLWQVGFPSPSHPLLSFQTPSLHPCPLWRITEMGTPMLTDFLRFCFLFSRLITSHKDSSQQPKQFNFEGCCTFCLYFCNSLSRWLGNYVNFRGAELEIQNTFLISHQLFLSPLLR